MIPKALPPGTNHHAATRLVESQMQGIVDAATEQQTAPQQAAQRMKVELPAKTKRAK